MIIGFFKSFDPFLDRSIFPDYFHSLIGGVCGYFIIWLLIFVYKKLKNKEGMGLGDAKLLSALGFWFGWISIPFILIFSSLTALGFSLPSLIKKSKNLSTEIPFGPHMVIGCILYVVLKANLNAEEADSLKDLNICKDVTGDEFGDLCPSPDHKGWYVRLERDESGSFIIPRQYRKASAPPTSVRNYIPR